MAKILWLVWIFTFPFAAFAQTQSQSVPNFVAGIDKSAAKICAQEIEKSKCKLESVFTEYKNCVQNVLVRHKTCKQSLTFFKLTDGGVFKQIRTYPNMDVILADYVYIADQGTGYFLVTHSGQFFALPLLISNKQLKAAPNYQSLVKRYPRLNVWQILDFPRGVKLSPNRYRLIFTQQLKDGCNACALAGTAKVAYDFSSDGKQFYGVKILKLIPNKAH